MMIRVYLYALILVKYLCHVHATPLDVVTGKSGEEQVKEALERAQKESEEAAKESKQRSQNFKAQNEIRHFLKSPPHSVGRLSEHTSPNQILQTDHSVDRLKENNLLIPEKYAEEAPQVKSIRGNPKKPKESAIDLFALKKALGLLHKGNGRKAGGPQNVPGDIPGSKTSYKEDTKLEDRLAMEAEEEKKFSNSDNYGDEMPDSSKASSSSSQSQASFSPKEQASKEMQSYNDLISSESNRELSQIQEEITKATQSSMGQVSVVGQKEHVATESPTPPLGGIGSLDGLGSMNSESNFLNSPGNPSSQFPGSTSSNDALDVALQSEMNTQSTSFPSSSGVENQQASMPNQDSTNQVPIEIGGGSQEPTEMGGMAAASNPFAGSPQNQVETMSAGQNNFMEQAGDSSSEEMLRGASQDPQQSMTFKKSMISKTDKSEKVKKN